MSAGEVMTTSIVAALFFGGNMECSHAFLQEQGYIPQMLEKSRFNRRQHQMAGLFLTVFNLLGEVWKQLNCETCISWIVFRSLVWIIIGSGVATSIRAKSGGATKPARSDYYGLKIHLMVALQSQPVEFFLTRVCGVIHEILKMYHFDFSEGSLVTGDKAYTDYEIEDILEVAGIELEPLRNKLLAPGTSMD